MSQPSLKIRTKNHHHLNFFELSTPPRRLVFSLARKLLWSGRKLGCVGEARFGCGGFEKCGPVSELAGKEGAARFTWPWTCDSWDVNACAFSCSRCFIFLSLPPSVSVSLCLSPSLSPHTYLTRTYLTNVTCWILTWHSHTYCMSSSHTYFVRRTFCCKEFQQNYAKTCYYPPPTHLDPPSSPPLPPPPHPHRCSV